MQSTMENILSRDEVRAAVRRTGPVRPPVVNALVCEPALLDEHPEPLRELIAQHPDDTAFYNIHVDYWQGLPGEPGYRWAFGDKQKPAGVSIDDCPVIETWDELDAFLAEMPDPHHEKPIRDLLEVKRRHPNQYMLVSFGHYFHQKLASIRGMQNLLFDFYDHRAELERLMDAWIDYYAVLAARIAAIGADGVYGGDDLGTQLSLFMSPEIFRRLYLPYYRKLADILHGNGLDFWLHTCGNVTAIMPDLIASGVDIIHPIQCGAMDAEATVRQWRGKISFFVGMDVQHLIPFAKPDEVRRGILERARLFYDPAGGGVYGAGNVLVAGTPLENIKTYIETLHAFCREQSRSTS